MDWLKSEFFRGLLTNLKGSVRFLLRGGGYLFLSYLLASVVSVLVMALLIESALPPKGAPRATSVRPDEISLVRNINYRNLVKAVQARNIFNRSGEFPDESQNSESSEGKKVEFDPNQPCSKNTLNLELLGTIFVGSSGDSLATVMEGGVSSADIYRKGDKIIGHEDAIVYDIGQKLVVLNNNNKKECLELKDPDGGMVWNQSASPVETKKPKSDSGIVPDSGVITLEPGYVKAQIGDDFSTILATGRLIPETQGQQMIGFKLIGVQPNSLYAKLGLKSNDVITQVNEVSMREPDRGFEMYQALQDNEEISINFLRDGNPKTVNVQIR